MNRLLYWAVVIAAMFVAVMHNAIPATAAGYTGVGVEYQASERGLSSDESYRMIAAVADTAYIQRNWHEWLHNADVCTGDIAVARSKGLKVYLALDLLSYDDVRGHVVLADKKSGKFADAKVKDDYLSLVGKVANERPDYLILLVEANLYKDKKPADYEAFRQILPEAIRIVRRKSPHTKLGVSITYGDHNLKNGVDADDLAYFKSCVRDFDSSTDMLAVSSYPFYILDPVNLPPDFIHSICSYSKKPLFLAETSWVSESFDIDLPDRQKFKFVSNVEKQADYCRRLFASVKDAIAHGDTVQCVNFVSLTDPKPLSSFLFKLISPKFAWLTSLALCDNQGHPKPAYLVLKGLRTQHRQ